MKRSIGPDQARDSKVAIVIVHYNGENLIRMCLKSLRKTNYSDYRIFVFDNGSTDNTAEIITNEFPEATLFSVPKNLGLTKAANKAFSLAMEAYHCDYIAFLNNDIEVISPDWLSGMVQTAQEIKGTGVVGCKLLYPDGTIQHAGELFWPDRLRGKGESAEKYGSVEELRAVTFAASLIRTEVFKKIGFFDEVFSPFYYEDLDFCFRAKKSGFKSVYAGNVSLTHHEGGSLKFNTEHEYIVARNAIIFYARYAPLFEFMKIVARIYLRLIIRRADKRKDFGKGNVSILLSPTDLIMLPYRILLISMAIFHGLLLYRKNKVPVYPLSLFIL